MIPGSPYALAIFVTICFVLVAIAAFIGTLGIFASNCKGRPTRGFVFFSVVVSVCAALLVAYMLSPITSMVWMWAARY